MIDGIKTAGQVILWLVVSHPVLVILPLLMIGAIVHCVRNPYFNQSDKTLWIVLLIVLTPASLIAYVIVSGMKKREKIKSNLTPDGIRQPADGSPKPSV